MATTEDIQRQHGESHTRAATRLGDGIDRAMQDADARLNRLVERLRNAAHGSPAFETASRDAQRVLDWFHSRAQDLEAELRTLSNRAAEAAESLDPRKGRGDGNERPPRNFGSFDTDVGGG